MVFIVATGKAAVDVFLCICEPDHCWSQNPHFNRVMFIVGSTQCCLKYFHKVYTIVQLWNEVIVYMKAQNKAVRHNFDANEANIHLSKMETIHIFKGLYGT